MPSVLSDSGAHRLGPHNGHALFFFVFFLVIMCVCHILMASDEWPIPAVGFLSASAPARIVGDVPGVALRAAGGGRGDVVGGGAAAAMPTPGGGEGGARWVEWGSHAP